MASLDDLGRTLARLDGRGYKAYRDIAGAWREGPLTLFVDHVQRDPFAAPSRMRLRLAQDEARLPPELWEDRTRRLALADFLARAARRGLPRRAAEGNGKSGVVHVDAGGQEVLERTAVVIDPAWVELRLEAGLPAAGRRILGDEARRLLCAELPRVAERALRWEALPADAARRFVACVENQEHLRGALEAEGLVAFVADGSLLPRESGASDRPLAHDAVALRAPEALAIRVPLPNPVETPDGPTHQVRGLGIRPGVTLVVGGGYHGKSTLLRALERGIHPHIPGDGRELVVTRPDAVKIRAEDGRRVEQVDISAFVSHLPRGRPTDAFSSDDASGSTSQAANIVEALEAGSRLLLLDEDTCATNFMVRDARMQALVASDREPITPFVDRVGELHERLGVSTVLVMGGSGDYFDVADTVIRMDEFEPYDATAQAHRIAATHPTGRRPEARAALRPIAERVPLPGSLDPSRGRRAVRVDARGREEIGFGRERIDLRAVEQILEPSQTRAIAHALVRLGERWIDGERTVREMLDALETLLDREGLDALALHGGRGRHPGNLARPRRFEVAAALNRLRSARMRQRRPRTGASTRA